jgi:hypothetical protein
MAVYAHAPGVLLGRHGAWWQSLQQLQTRGWGQWPRPQQDTCCAQLEHAPLRLPHGGAGMCRT